MDTEVTMEAQISASLMVLSHILVSHAQSGHGCIYLILVPTLTLEVELWQWLVHSELPVTIRSTKAICPSMLVQVSRKHLFSFPILAWGWGLQRSWSPGQCIYWTLAGGDQIYVLCVADGDLSNFESDLLALDGCMKLGIISNLAPFWIADSKFFLNRPAGPFLGACSILYSKNNMRDEMLGFSS